MNTIKFIARMPMRWLYAFASFLYFLAYYVARHRQQVIREQIQKVFPQKSQDERVALHQQYLKNYCQVFVEILKSTVMTPEQMKSHVVIADLTPARDYLDAGRSIMFVTSHLGNWEWLLHGMALHLGFPLDAAYKPLHDARSERLMLRVRSRFGARLIPAKEVLADFLKRRGIVRALAMNADQAPVSTDQRHWTQFLGQETAFYIGAEQISRATRLPIIFLAMRRVRRGFYEVKLYEIWNGKERLEPGEITERYARLCETEVYAQPADWLWSYRRWKLKRPLYEEA